MRADVALSDRDGRSATSSIGAAARGAQPSAVRAYGKDIGSAWTCLPLPLSAAQLSGPGFVVRGDSDAAAAGTEGGLWVTRTADGGGDVLLYWDAATTGAISEAVEEDGGASLFVEWAAARALGHHPFQARTCVSARVCA